jgi:hypothetical protein
VKTVVVFVEAIDVELDVNVEVAAGFKEVNEMLEEEVEVEVEEKEVVLVKGVTVSALVSIIVWCVLVRDPLIPSRLVHLTF